MLPLPRAKRGRTAESLFSLRVAGGVPARAEAPWRRWAAGEGDDTDTARSATRHHNRRVQSRNSLVTRNTVTLAEICGNLRNITRHLCTLSELNATPSPVTPAPVDGSEVEVHRFEMTRPERPSATRNCERRGHSRILAQTRYAVTLAEICGKRRYTGRYVYADKLLNAVPSVRTRAIAHLKASRRRCFDNILTTSSRSGKNGLEISPTPK